MSDEKTAIVILAAYVVVLAFVCVFQANKQAGLERKIEFIECQMDIAGEFIEQHSEIIFPRNIKPVNK